MLYFGPYKRFKMSHICPQNPTFFCKLYNKVKCRTVKCQWQNCFLQKMFAQIRMKNKMRSSNVVTWTSVITSFTKLCKLPKNHQTVCIYKKSTKIHRLLMIYITTIYINNILNVDNLIYSPRITSSYDGTLSTVSGWGK
jgi:hypothetical protein